MPSKWHEKKAKQAAEQFERELQGTKDSAMDPSKLASEVAMGGGEDQFYEKKMSKEEKKAAAKEEADKAHDAVKDDPEAEIKPAEEAAYSIEGHIRNLHGLVEALDLRNITLVMQDAASKTPCAPGQ